MVRVRLKSRGDYPFCILCLYLFLSLKTALTTCSWIPISPTWESDSVLIFTAYNRTFRLLLKETEHLIGDNFTTHHHHPHTGQIVENVIGRNGSEKCHWNGYLEGSRDSLAAVSTCPSIGGVIRAGEDVYHLHSDGTQALISKSHDLSLPEFKCGNSHNSSDNTLLSRNRRNAETPVFADMTYLNHPPSATNSKSRFVEMVIVHDNRQFIKFGRDKYKLFERSKQIANIVNAVYAPINIFVILVGVRVWTNKDEIEVNVNAETTLDNFLRYRMMSLAKSMPNDNAQLVTDILFENDVVGKALKGPICTYQYSGGVNKDHHESVAVVASTIAHELGHNFGMEHDDVMAGHCECPQQRCIMYPASNTLVPPTAWSSCSVKSINEAFQQHMDHCLLNIPGKIVGPSCGNGIVEEGEECDCGPENFCATKCCNALTCKISEGALCGHGECCDLSTCKPKTAGLKCRDEESECDLPEHCDGEKPFCPPNVFKANGVKCGDGEAYCFKGSCASHTQQCKNLWGPTGKVAHELCFKVNSNGTQIGNCGYNRTKKTFARCKKKDIMCGTLHCTYHNERLEYGMLSASKLSRFFLKADKVTRVCRSAMVDLGATDPDPGQVPNGAACGPNLACLESECVPVAELMSPPCEYSCFGHGTCNHLGHCHCDAGYAPPYCNFPGTGGSVDSGPTTSLEGESYTLTIVLSIVFLGIVPLVLFFAAWTIFSKKDFMTKWRLRRRKLAVKNAARQGPLLNLYDKAQISKPVDFSSSKLQFTSSTTSSLVHKQQSITNGIDQQTNRSVESNVDVANQIRPARPAPPPPPGKVGRTAANNSGTDDNRLRSLKRSKSSDNSIRRPSAPPPPKPSPLYENMDAIRAQLNSETKEAPAEGHPLV